jgi:hypothetical protein
MPTVTLIEFTDNEKTITVRADHIAAIARRTDDGPVPYTSVEMLRDGILGFRGLYIVKDAHEDYLRNPAAWKAALSH